MIRQKRERVRSRTLVSEEMWWLGGNRVAAGCKSRRAMLQDVYDEDESLR